MILSFIFEDFIFFDVIFVGYVMVGVMQDVEFFVVGIIGVESNLGFLNVGDENFVEVILGDFGIGELVFVISFGGGVFVLGVGGVVSVGNMVFVSVGWVNLIG